jgi:hypothetical protein
VRGARKIISLPATSENKAPVLKTQAAPRFVIETNAEVSSNLAPEHRKQPPVKVKGALLELARSLVELTADVPAEPSDTRTLRLTLAVIDLAPECTRTIRAKIGVCL